MEERPAMRAAREAHIWLQTFVVAIVALVLLFVFVARPVMVDVVVLRKDFENVTGPIVKRVIAVGGQTVEIDYAAGTVAVDGTVLTEDYILEPMVQRSWQSVTTLTVPEGCVFVMGDNRNISNDSRNPALGAVEEAYILGQAVAVLFPFQNFGAIS